MSNLPLYLSLHSFHTWCGEWHAPKARKVSHGLSGLTEVWLPMKAIVWSTTSSEKW